MVAGCGAPNQSLGLTPKIAQRIARICQRSVAWRAVGKLGATMRRVRYRFLPQIAHERKAQGTIADILVICAASNDIMARRTLSEWKDDLAASIDLSLPLASHVVVLSSGWLYRTPSLGRALRHRLGIAIQQQTAASKAVCASRHVAYVSFVDGDIACPPDFWASDRFHPSLSGYDLMADTIIKGMQRYRILPSAPGKGSKVESRDRAKSPANR